MSDFTPYVSRQQALGYMRLHIRNASSLATSLRRKDLIVSKGMLRRTKADLKYERESARDCARIAGLI